MGRARCPGAHIRESEAGMIPHSWYEFFALVADSATSYYLAISRAQAKPGQIKKKKRKAK